MKNLKFKLKNRKPNIGKIIIIATMLLSASGFSQKQTLDKLPSLFIGKGVNLIFRSPEPVQFVDISTDKLIGDMPAENIIRIKIRDEIQQEITTFSKKDTIKSLRRAPAQFYIGEELGIITVVGQSFMAQYKLIFNETDSEKIVTNLQIEPKDMQMLEYPDNEFSNRQLEKFCLNLIGKNARNPVRTKNALKLSVNLNNVYVASDYIFLDLTFKNSSNLWYDIDQIKFSIDDKKVYKSTNVQSVDLEPVYQLYKQKSFKKSFRNIYVFKKFTYPNDKVLTIRMMEDQISGRTIDLPIKYKDILNADTF